MLASKNFSDDYKQMGETAKNRYNDKLDRIALEVDDPYTLKASKRSDIVPNIEFPDIYNFFINTPSPFTKEELKSYKSLDGYKYLVASWVGDLSVHPVAMRDEKLVLTASLRHSQSVSVSHLKPLGCCRKVWNYHLCTLYMYGGAWRGMLTHCCLLFAVEVQNCLKDTSCTSEPWLSPTMQNVLYAPFRT